MTSAACRNCGTALAGDYCHSCGEARPHEHEFQWRHFLHDVVHEFLHLDGKIFRTLWLLIRRPGFLTQEYWDGRRTPYIRPLRLYIVIAAIHLLVVSSGLYRMDFFRASDSRGSINRVIDKIAKQTNRSAAEVEASMNANLAKAYSVGQYGAVLFFALFPWVTYRRTRPYYIAHLIFSLHIYCFYFLFTSFISPFVHPEMWIRAPFWIVTTIYIAVAVRLLYSESWRRTIAKALWLRAGLFAAEATVLGISMFVAVFLSFRTH